MPRLKQLSCSIEWASDPHPLKEYGVIYGDGIVESTVAVPEDTPIPFAIRLRSSGYIAPGLAMFVFIDGVYQCNRNRNDLRPIDVDDSTSASVSKTDKGRGRGRKKEHGKARKACEVNFRVRQKEEELLDGTWTGRPWRFEPLNTGVKPERQPSRENNPKNSQHLGTIHVLVLRCQGAPNDSWDDASSQESGMEAYYSKDDENNVPGFGGTLMRSVSPVRFNHTGIVSAFDGPSDLPPQLDGPWDLPTRTASRHNPQEFFRPWLSMHSPLTGIEEGDEGETPTWDNPADCDDYRQGWKENGGSTIQDGETLTDDLCNCDDCHLNQHQFQGQEEPLRNLDTPVICHCEECEASSAAGFTPLGVAPLQPHQGGRAFKNCQQLSYQNQQGLGIRGFPRIRYDQYAAENRFMIPPIVLNLGTPLQAPSTGQVLSTITENPNSETPSPITHTGCYTFHDGQRIEDTRGWRTVGETIQESPGSSIYEADPNAPKAHWPNFDASHQPGLVTQHDGNWSQVAPTRPTSVAATASSNQPMHSDTHAAVSAAAAAFLEQNQTQNKETNGRSASVKSAPGWWTGESQVKSPWAAAEKIQSINEKRCQSAWGTRTDAPNDGNTIDGQSLWEALKDLSNKNWKVTNSSTQGSNDGETLQKQTASRPTPGQSPWAVASKANSAHNNSRPATAQTQKSAWAGNDTNVSYHGSRPNTSYSQNAPWGTSVHGNTRPGTSHTHQTGWANNSVHGNTRPQTAQSNPPWTINNGNVQNSSRPNTSHTQKTGWSNTNDDNSGPQITPWTVDAPQASSAVNVQNENESSTAWNTDESNNANTQAAADAWGNWDNNQTSGNDNDNWTTSQDQDATAAWTASGNETNNDNGWSNWTPAVDTNNSDNGDSKTSGSSDPRLRNTGKAPKHEQVATESQSKPIQSPWTVQPDQSQPQSEPTSMAHSYPPEDERRLSHQVQIGQKSRYVHRICKPKYLDTMDEPYAKFVFHYRKADYVEQKFGVKIDKDPEDERRKLEALPRSEIVKRLLTAKGVLTDDGDESTATGGKTSKEPSGSEPAPINFSLPGNINEGLPSSLTSPRTEAAASAAAASGWNGRHQAFAEDGNAAKRSPAGLGIRG